MSDAMHETTSPVTSIRSRPAAGAWDTIPVGESRFNLVRRQLRMMQIQRAAFGSRAA